MIIVNQSHEILNISHPDPALFIGRCARTCYKSEDKSTPERDRKLCVSCLKRNHHSVIEHVSATVRFITNRGVTHELVRHRLASFSQESTRYVNYGGHEMEFIKPVWWDDNWRRTIDMNVSKAHYAWQTAMVMAEKAYNRLLDAGWNPGQARDVLPNALKTEIIVSANLREWLHIFNLRTSTVAHPQMRELMTACRDEFKERVPELFSE